jgi:hypothetical protein
MTADITAYLAGSQQLIAISFGSSMRDAASQRAATLVMFPVP